MQVTLELHLCCNMHAVRIFFVKVILDPTIEHACCSYDLQYKRTIDSVHVVNVTLKFELKADVITKEEKL